MLRYSLLSAFWWVVIDYRLKKIRAVSTYILVRLLQFQYTNTLTYQTLSVSRQRSFFPVLQR